MKDVMTPAEVKEARKYLKMTSEELGEELGVTGNTVRRWECGVKTPSRLAVKFLRRLVEDEKELHAVPA